MADDGGMDGIGEQSNTVLPERGGQNSEGKGPDSIYSVAPPVGSACFESRSRTHTKVIPGLSLAERMRICRGASCWVADPSCVMIDVLLLLRFETRSQSTDWRSDKRRLVDESKNQGQDIPPLYCPGLATDAVGRARPLRLSRRFWLALLVGSGGLDS